VGTPIVDRNKLARELAALLSKLEYTQMLARENEDREMRQQKDLKRANLKAPTGKPAAYQPANAAQLAKEAVDAAFGDVNQPNLLDPISVVELRPASADIWLYRLYDGISHKTALTLGRWWCTRTLLTEIWHATRDLSGDNRKRRTLEFLKSAMFVHPSWNFGTNIAQMKIGGGCSVPAIIGRGSWTAMKSARNAPTIQTEDDVIEKLGMMPIPGPKQVFLPLFNDMWVRGVPELSPDWPLS
jgi:hypothetical protein